MGAACCAKFTCWASNLLMIAETNNNRGKIPFNVKTKLEKDLDDQAFFFELQ
jgi:hypothetical protein